MKVSAATSPHESGVVVMIAALLIVPLIIFVSLTLNFSFATLVRTETQVVADSAAHAAAATLCSTRDCYNRSYIAAVRSVHQQIVHGNVGQSAVIDLSNVLASLEERYQATLGEQASEEYVSGGPVWEADGFRITIQRGRWWGDGAPSGISTLADDTRFESFDVMSGTSWQDAHPAVPNFLAANAVRVVIERQEINWLLVPLASMQGTYRIVARSIAVGAAEDSEVCVAPFAIPACALLDQTREFEPDVACQFDRFFTSPRRYCRAGEEDCDVIPGSWWSPLTEIYCDEPWRTMFPNRCACYRMQTDPSSTPKDKNLLCGEFAGYPSLQCSFYPYPVFGRTSQHFGVVGLPERAASGPPEEWSIQEVVGDSVNYCVPARIHDRFHIREEGLTENTTEDLLWKQMSDQYDTAEDEAHPLQIKTDLGTSLTVMRAKDGQQYPQGPMAKFIDFMIAKGMADPADFVRVNNTICPNAGEPQWGACNSRRYAYDERCAAWWFSYVVPITDWPKLGTEQSRAQWSFLPTLRPPVLSWPDGQGGQISWSEWRDGFPDNPDFPFDCENNLPYLACPYPHHSPLANASGSAYYTETDTPVWRIAIPIIADYSATKACARGGKNDPVLDPSRDWRIIGFVKVNLFDADIGRPPPKPPGSGVRPAGWPGPPSWTNWVKQTFGVSVPKSMPPVCSYEEGRMPWGFAPYGPGSETNCNMVRGRTACDTGLIASADLGSTKREIRFVR